jgi:hypothetical protein
MDAGLTHLPAMRLEPSAAARVLRGQTVAVQAEPASLVRLYDSGSNRFLGVGRVIDGALQPRRLVASSRGVEHG